MLPCFFGGFWSRLLRRSSSAWISIAVDEVIVVDLHIQKFASKPVSTTTIVLHFDL